MFRPINNSALLVCAALLLGFLPSLVLAQQNPAKHSSRRNKQNVTKSNEMVRADKTTANSSSQSRSSAITDSENAGKSAKNINIVDRVDPFAPAKRVSESTQLLNVTNQPATATAIGPDTKTAAIKKTPAQEKGPSAKGDSARSSRRRAARSAGSIPPKTPVQAKRIASRIDVTDRNPSATATQATMMTNTDSRKNGVNSTKSAEQTPVQSAPENPSSVGKLQKTKTPVLKTVPKTAMKNVAKTGAKVPGKMPVPKQDRPNLQVQKMPVPKRNVGDGVKTPGFVKNPYSKSFANKAANKEGQMGATGMTRVQTNAPGRLDSGAMSSARRSPSSPLVANSTGRSVNNSTIKNKHVSKPKMAPQLSAKMLSQKKSATKKSATKKSVTKQSPTKKIQSQSGRMQTKSSRRSSKSVVPIVSPENVFQRQVTSSAPSQADRVATQGPAKVQTSMAPMISNRSIVGNSKNNAGPINDSAFDYVPSGFKPRITRSPFASQLKAERNANQQQFMSPDRYLVNPKQYLANSTASRTPSHSYNEFAGRNGNGSHRVMGFNSNSNSKIHREVAIPSGNTNRNLQDPIVSSVDSSTPSPQTIEERRKEYLVDLGRRMPSMPAQDAISYVDSEGNDLQRQPNKSKLLLKSFANYDGLPTANNLTRSGTASGVWYEQYATWRSPNLKYRPLYFEDRNLERYGASRGRTQPISSALHFFISTIQLPYHMGVDAPCCTQYSIGHGRPGNEYCLPAEKRVWSRRAATFQALFVAAGVWGLP